MNKLVSDTVVVPRFTSQYCCTRKKSALDATYPYRNIIKRIEPFAVDKDGKVINKTSFPIFKVVGKVDIDDQIQSFKNDVDIYKILERVVATGDMSILNVRQALFEDIYNIPDNIHEVDALVKKLNTKEVKDVINNIVSNNNSSKEDLSSLIQKEVAAALVNMKGSVLNGETSES